MTLGGACIIAFIALLTGIEIGLWLARPVEADDIDWTNAA